MNFHPKENSIDTANICVPILISMFNPKSVLDLGCNIGAWMHSFESNGVSDVFGVDGDNMEVNKFKAHDLTKPLNLKRKFDMVLCLEVAEHIDEQYSETLIDSAIRHSDLIIWSAATKGQGGYNHVNEQPIEYWIDKFKAKGYIGKYLGNSFPILPHDYYRKNLIEFRNENITN